jgi:hypothetical protein
MVIEDDIQVRAYLREMLETEGYEVREADNGKEGPFLSKEWGPPYGVHKPANPRMLACGWGTTVYRIALDRRSFAKVLVTCSLATRSL